uniref:Uncharacterized protein n=1 Tax=Oryctolagus cuniculus TaxID=9986 RepID=A0A5F9DIL9_RABIT
MPSWEADVPQEEREEMTRFQGGAAAAGPHPEGAVPGCDAGELQEPGRSGAPSLQIRYGVPVGSRRKTLEEGSRDPRKQESKR